MSRFHPRSAAALLRTPAVLSVLWLMTRPFSFVFYIDKMREAREGERGNVQQHSDSGGRAAAVHWARRHGRHPVVPSSCPQLQCPDVVCAQMPCFQCGQMNTTTTILNDFGQPVFQCRCVRLAGKIDLFRVSRSIRAVLARERVSVVRCVLVHVCVAAGATKTPAHSNKCAHACPCLCV